jgi:hypothetical protein
MFLFFWKLHCLSYTAICFYFYEGKSDFVRLRTDSRNKATHNDMLKMLDFDNIYAVFFNGFKQSK